jgi:ribosomal protein S18 acetylase RimI-like enzyme
MVASRTFEIRFVEAWDSSQIVTLYRAGGCWKDEYEEAGIPALIRGSFLFAVAFDTITGRAVGMGRVISDGVSDGYIQDLVVLPDCRRSGIGKQIIEALVRECRKRGLGWIGLVSQPGCETFYSELGFVKMEGFVPLIFKGDA